MPEATSNGSTRLLTTRDRWVLAAIVVLGLVSTTIGTRLAWLYRGSQQEYILVEAAREIENNLSREAGAVEAFVETVAAFMESSVEVSHAEFDSFAGRTAGLWPGLVSVEWQAWVPREERAAFEARMQKDFPGFRIVERDGAGQLIPAAERDVHLPIVHLHGVVNVMVEPGLDRAATREWFEAELAAVEATHAVASSSFAVLGADGRGLGEGFSISDVVLTPGPGPARERLRGFVAAVFAYRPMIEVAIAGTRLEHLRVTVRDSADVVPVYYSWRADNDAEAAAPPQMQVRSEVLVAGRSWEVAIAAMPGFFPATVRVIPWFVLTGGVMATLGGVLAIVWRLRRRGERATRAAERFAIERRFRDIVDRMSGAVLVVRPRDGAALRFEIVELNAAAAGLLSCTSGSVTGRLLTDVLPGLADSGLLAALEQVHQRGDVHGIDALSLAQKDSTRHLEGVAFRVGQGGDICAVLQDLTDLKSAERALREARDELELALDVSRVGLWSWDLGQKRIRLDARCGRLYGLADVGTIDEAAITSRVQSEDLKIVREEIDRAVRELRAYEVEYRVTLDDGTLRYLCTRARPVREGALPVNKIVGCTWDVTERRRMEEHLRRTQRLESLGTLAGGVAHDLNNALAPVTMGLDLLKRRVAQDPEAVDSIKLMQTSVRRASSIVRQLIAFKRGAGESKQPDPAHPKRILEVLGTTLVESFPKEISVLIEPASLDLPRIVADEREAHQVLLNLCVNARDSMPQGGRLVVSCEGCELGAGGTPLFPELRPGAYVMFTVTDTGRGIAPEIRHRVFDPFFTTKEVGKGSGLGLSTALGIVKAHRGGMQFESKEGIGTTFRVVFPALADDEPPKTVPIAAVSTPAAGAAPVPFLLLVDDEQQVRELARRALEQSGFKVVTASNGREAVELFTQHIQAIDAVIMDLLMPVMNGAAATAAIKRLRPDVPIVGASGFATDALVDEAKTAGITTFLPKPFTVTILVDAVRAAMAKKTG
jgi:signal transduction histidine kinase/ActR/RegA family two-component response regulator/CHASE1-domain containing sensor protein